jgi:hypothetical protein
MRVHPQALLDVTLRKSAMVQVNASRAGARAGDRGLVQANA